MLTKVDKALVAFILAAAGYLGSIPVVQGESVNLPDVVTAVVLGLIAAAGVWATPNKVA